MKVNKEDSQEINFSSYLETEEQNLRLSFVFLGNKIDFFYRLDDVYKELLYQFDNIKDIEGSLLIFNQYCFVHYHLYFSISCLLRCHLSDCYASTRKAIDASFITYETLLRPEFAKEYLGDDSGSRSYMYLKKNIQQAINQDSRAYPLAKPLLKKYDLFSKIGSHADPDCVLTGRVKVNKISESGKTTLKFLYFQNPENRTMMELHYMQTLSTYYEILRIFYLFFEKVKNSIKTEWNDKYESLGVAINSLTTELTERASQNSTETEQRTE